MDAFFASVEQLDNPELRGKPIAVGFDGPRGVVSTASYEARPFGVHSAMSIVKAKRLCPQLIIVRPRFSRYKEISRMVHEVFHEYTDVVEPLSLDEAFLDVTENKAGMELAVDIAREIKRKIVERTGLTASAGVSYCKFLAKVASDWRKPDGLYTIHPDRAFEFIDRLPIEKFWGVGPKTAETMHKKGIATGRDLRMVSLERLTEIFGKQGAVYYHFARGEDDRPVIVEREQKSVGCEQTYLEDLHTPAQRTIELYHLVLELVARISKLSFDGRTLTLKIKFNDFVQITRSVTSPRAFKTKTQILPAAKQLMASSPIDRPVRLLGLSVSKASSSDFPANDQPQWIEGVLDFAEN